MGFDVDDKIKLQFLNYLLESDEEIVEQFNRYISNLNNIKNDDFKDFVETIFEKLNFIDIDGYVDMCSFYDYYDEDVCSEIAQDLLMEYRELIDSLYEKGNIYKIFWVILAIYMAIKQEPELNDDYGLCYSYEESLLIELEDIIYDNIDILKGIEDSKRVEILKLLVSKLKEDFDYKFFNKIFLNLINSKEIAQYAKSYIDNFDILIKLHILDILKEDIEYIKLAKNSFKDNFDVGKLLLEKLYKLDRYDEFEDIAKYLFKNDANYWVDFLLERVKKEKSPLFYKDLIKYKALHNNFDRFKELKSLANQDEIEEIISQIKESYYRYDYYIKILIYEKRFDELLNYVKSNYNVDFLLYAKALVEHYPKEILEMVIDKCNKEMNAFRRSRENYKKMASMLSAVYNSTIKDELDRYIQTIYNHQPRLPALRDELEKVNLV